jgi:N-acetyl sugar amidotransferase
MDTSDPEIVFDAAGACNHCRSYNERNFLLRLDENQKQEALKALVAQVKHSGEGRPYDAVLGVSGGVDSSYLAYVMHRAGVRVLLVHIDNGWNSAQSVLNIKNICERLDLDYESVVLDWEELRDIQLSFLRASVVEAETPTDIAILGGLHRVAAKYGIRSILGAGNPVTEGILPRLWHYSAKDTIYFRSIQRRFGRRRIRTFPLFGPLTEAWYKLGRGMRILYPMAYIPFEREKAILTLESELGWRGYGGKHHESRYTKFVQSYLLPKKFGIDYRRATLSSLICAGQLDRATAIETLTTPTFSEGEIQGEKEYVARKLRISVSHLDEIVSLPPKFYFDYPNGERRLALINNVYRRLIQRSATSFSGQSSTAC